MFFFIKMCFKCWWDVGYAWYQIVYGQIARDMINLTRQFLLVVLALGLLGATFGRMYFWGQNGHLGVWRPNVRKTAIWRRHEISIKKQKPFRIIKWGIYNTVHRKLKFESIQIWKKLQSEFWLFLPLSPSSMIFKILLCLNFFSYLN